MMTAATGAGCHHHGAQRFGATGAVGADSVSGVVSITGTAFEQHIVLCTASGIRALTMSSADDSLALSALGGANVVAYGAARPNGFELSRFVVRSVDGRAVADGVLVREGTRYILRTRSDTLALGNPPAAFGMLIGARLWVGGPLDTGPNVYGVILPASK
jgi:hypothetical protein